MATVGFLFGGYMTQLNRKQRRALGKMVNKQAASSIDLMLGIADHCLTCNKPFDRMSKEMARSWFIEVYKENAMTCLFCPECYQKRGQNEGST
jgi:uncharacterized protein with PIN domain